MIGRRLGSHGAAPAHASRFVPAPQGTVFVPACAPSSTGCLRLRPRRLRSHQSKFHRAQGRGGPRHLIWTSQQPRWPADRHRSARRRRKRFAASPLHCPCRPEGPAHLTRPLPFSLPTGVNGTYRQETPTDRRIDSPTAPNVVGRAQGTATGLAADLEEGDSWRSTSVRVPALGPRRSDT